MKYIIEIEEKPLCVFDNDTHTYFPRLWRVKGFNSLVFDEEGLSRLEELNSDYINEHFSDLQDDAYNKGYAQCQDDYSDALKHAKDVAYKKGYDAGIIASSFVDKSDDAYQRGLDDAWEAARKIADMWTRIDNDELLETFGVTAKIGESVIGTLFNKQTANEAMLELEAYEEKQKAEDEIKVGDEVETKDGKRFVVTTFGSGFDGDIAVGVCADGLGLGVDLKELHKTGRHFDIASILKEMQS